jgi:hypothetical protein
MLDTAVATFRMLARSATLRILHALSSFSALECFRLRFKLAAELAFAAILAVPRFNGSLNLQVSGLVGLRVGGSVGGSVDNIICTVYNIMQ